MKSWWSDLPVAFVIVDDDGTHEISTTSLVSKLPPGLYLLTPHDEALSLDAVRKLEDMQYRTMEGPEND